MISGANEEQLELANARADILLLQQENQELKKKLEELDKKLFFTKNELDMRQKSIDDKLNQ